MEHIESEFEGQKGLTIYYQAWLPDEKPKAVIHLVHGFGEHSGRYGNVVEKLVPMGYAIYADDHRGHGKSEGIENYVESFEYFIEDEKKLYDIIKEKHSDIPYFILGHSMGSGIAQHFANKYQDLLDGLIISGAGNTVGEDVSGFVIFMSKIFSKIAPKMTFDSNLDANFLSHDPEVVQAYIEDPLVHYKEITARLAKEMMDYFSILDEIVEDLTIPLLVQCGSEDKAVFGIEELKEHYKMEDKTVNIYNGLYHEVYNEPPEKREQVLNDLAEWLDSHI
ncbi:MAG: alpha/beta hydrolase [Promethearchaeota archaeon]|nr:MAG: alpha/beta hydrolase [Candidatus Lokiarchaeota archaeon]